MLNPESQWNNFLCVLLFLFRRKKTRLYPSMFLKIEQNVLLQGMYGSIFLCWMSRFKLNIRHASLTPCYIDLSFQSGKKVKITVSTLNFSEKRCSRKLCCTLGSPFVWGWVKWADDLQENESSKGLPQRGFTNGLKAGRSSKRTLHPGTWSGPWHLVPMPQPHFSLFVSCCT